MKKIKKILAGAVATAVVLSTSAINSLAATVDLPDAFSDLSPIIEIVLKIVEFISKIISFLS